MTPRTHLTALGLTLALLTGATLTACADGGHPAQDTATPNMASDNTIQHTGRADPDAVLCAAAAAVYSWRPSHDPDPGAGFLRAAAAALLNPSYVHQVGPTASGLAQVTATTWQRWHDTDATITATTRIGNDDHPPDTPTRHQRVVIVTQHVLAPTPEPDSTLTVYMTATRAGPQAEWQVALLSPK